jgi:hypothetical protein
MKICEMKQNHTRMEILGNQAGKDSGPAMNLWKVGRGRGEVLILTTLYSAHSVSFEHHG